MQDDLPVYEFATTPLSHQLRLFNETRDKEVFGILWEQGTGKTKPTIDTACDLYERGKIDCVIVVAPNGVHRNWKSDELPKHVPQRLHDRIKCEFWETQKADTKGHAARMNALAKHDGMAWFLISYNGFMTKKGKEFVWKLLKSRKVFYVLDEAHNIAHHSKRSMSIIASSKYAKWKRILTGTPVATGPFDIYRQVKFLDNDIWKRYGLDNYTVFKFHFAEWFTAEECRALHGYDPGYDKLIDYKNIDQLCQILSSVSDRVLKADVLDLPPKVYSKRYFTLNKQQAEAYKNLRDFYEHELESGLRIEGNLAIVRLLRLHQVICGYAATEEGEDGENPTIQLGDYNPMLDEIEDTAASISHQGIIWARFTRDIDEICKRLGKKARRYDGTLPDDEAEKNKLDFQAGEYQWFVGNAQKGGTGLTLNMAKTMMFASQSFRFIDRLQAEDRFHRIGQTDSVNIIDFEAFLPDGGMTVSHHIINNLRRKYDIAAQITGDELREWI